MEFNMTTIRNKPWEKFEGVSSSSTANSDPQEFYLLATGVHVTSKGRDRVFECGDLVSSMPAEYWELYKDELQSGVMVDWNGLVGAIPCNYWDIHATQLALHCDGVYHFPFLIDGVTTSDVKRGCQLWFERSSSDFWITDEETHVNFPHEGTWDLVGVLFSDATLNGEGMFEADVLINYTAGYNKYYDVVESNDTLEVN